MAEATRQNAALRASLYHRAQQLSDLAEGDDPTGRNLALGGFTAPIRAVLQAP